LKGLKPKEASAISSPKSENEDKCQQNNCLNNWLDCLMNDRLFYTYAENNYLMMLTSEK